MEFMQDVILVLGLQRRCGLRPLPNMTKVRATRTTLARSPCARAHRLLSLWNLFAMDNQASTSSGSIDQRRTDALTAYRNVSETEACISMSLTHRTFRKCVTTKPSVRVSRIVSSWGFSFGWNFADSGFSLSAVLSQGSPEGLREDRG